MSVRKDYNIRVSLDELDYRVNMYGAHITDPRVYNFCVYRKTDLHGKPVGPWRYFVVGHGILAGRFGKAWTKQGAYRKARNMAVYARMKREQDWGLPILMEVDTPYINSPVKYISSPWHPKNWIEA